MTLHDLEVGTMCKIIKITNSKSLKHKFLDFGIKMGSILEVKNISLSKSNITVAIKNYTIALRNDEAAFVEVLKI